MPTWAKYTVLPKIGKYQYRPLLVKLGLVRVLTKLGYSGPSTELGGGGGLNIKPQNIFFLYGGSKLDEQNGFLGSQTHF